MAFDYKKACKELYLPKDKPEIVVVPSMNYVAVRGRGNPNEQDGAYQEAIHILYAVSYTIRMSHKGPRKIEGFFEYVVPPLESFWWQEGAGGFDPSDKSKLNWIAVIRLPDFVRKGDFDWAVAQAGRKKKLDCAKAAFYALEEGLCVQMLHTGPFDDEPASVALMDKYAEDNGYVSEFSEARLHHEIYLSDANKVPPSQWKTVIRHPIRRK